MFSSGDLIGTVPDVLRISIWDVYIDRLLMRVYAEPVPKIVKRWRITMCLITRILKFAYTVRVKKKSPFIKITTGVFKVQTFA